MAFGYQNFQLLLLLVCSLIRLSECGQDFKPGHLHNSKDVFTGTKDQQELFARLYKAMSNPVVPGTLGLFASSFTHGHRLKRSAVNGSDEINVQPGREAVELSENVTSIPVVTNGSLVKCEHDFQTLMNGVTAGEFWALQMMDAWGKPGPSLLQGRLNMVGSYKQCRDSRAPDNTSLGFSGSYCSVGIYLQIGTLPGAAGQIGACVPDSCSESDLQIVLGQGLKDLNLGIMLTSVEIRTDHREITTATIIAICVFSAIGVLVILGTMYDLIFIQIPKWKSQKVKRTEKTAEKYLSQEHSPNHDANPVTLISMTDKTEANGQRETTEKYSTNKDNSELKRREGTPASNGNCDVHTQSVRDKSVDKTKEGKKKLNACIMILLAFSVYTNGSKVLNTAQPPGSLSAINGIRFLSMSWVILGHTYFAATTEVGSVPMTAILEHLKDWTFDAIYNAGLAVDTFFTLSGLLVAYLTFKEIKKKGWKLNWPLFYFHRYWRLTPPYMLTMLLGQGFLAFMGSGATWSMKMPSDRENCKENWWTNLIYVNNVVHVDNMCMLHSWYLSNDMQFYVLSPLMIVPFYFHYAAGVVSCLVFLLAQMITSGVLSVDNNWTAVALFSGPAPKKDGLDWQTHYYFAPYGRIGPYIIGVMAGVLLATWKGKLRLHKAVVAVGWCVSTVSALAVLYGLHGDISGERYSTAPVSAFYNAVSRAVWGACISWIVLASASGYGGPVNKFLSWSAFVPLSRLTYMAYLIHPYIMVIYFGNLESAYHLMDSSLVVSFLGLLVVSNMAAFLLMLGMESPMIALEKGCRTE